MYELRVLNGLHQGAALPLFGEQWCIGASAEADLALYDPGIAVRHAWLRQIEQRWCVQAEQGLLQDHAGQVLAQIADLAVDLPFIVGGIELCVSLADHPWPSQPERASDSLEAPREPSPDLPLSTLSKYTQKRLMIALVVFAVLVTAVGAMNGGQRQAQASLMEAVPQKIDLPTPVDVRQQLLKMLNERELAQRVSLQVINGQIALGGNVSQEEVALLARMLERFAEQFDTPVAVMSRVREFNGQPPFKILQIVGGPNGHVVLGDGQRLFLGDEVDGLRLVTIDNTKVVFDGLQRYEVRW
jgi:type III secretion protein D